MACMASLPIEIIGWIGTVLIVGIYFLLTKGIVKSNSKAYQGTNLIGAVCVVINAVANKAYPPAGLNIIWSFIAIFGLYTAFKK